MNNYFEVVAKTIIKAIAFLATIFCIMTAGYLFAGETGGKQYTALQDFFSAVCFTAVYLAGLCFALDLNDRLSSKQRAVIYFLFVLFLPNVFYKISILL